MAFSINDFRSFLTGGGARPSLFQITITNPVDTIADIKVPMAAKATQLPESHLSTIPVMYWGRQIKYPGTRTFDPWTVTIIQDEDYQIRNALEKWNNAINSYEGNLDTLGSANPLLYKSQGTATLFGKAGDALRTYQFNGIWPSIVASTDLNWQTGDEIMEYQVTFEYDSFIVLDGPTGNAGGR